LGTSEFVAAVILSLDAALWAVALAALLPYLRRPQAIGHATYWLTAILVVAGIGILIESALHSIGSARVAALPLAGWLPDPDRSQLTFAVIQVTGMAAALTVILLVGSGRLASEAAVFIETARALREAEAGYRTMLDGAVDGIYRMTASGKLLRANPAYAKILGFDSQDECVAATTAHSPFYARPDRLADLMVAVAREGAVYRFESEVRQRDGGTIWISESVRAVADAAGEIAYIEGVMQDVTDRRRAREDLKLAAAVFDAAGDVIVVTDSGDTVQAVNPAFSEHTGFASDDVIGKRAQMLDLGRHDYALVDMMTRAIETQGQWRGEVWMRIKSGEAQQMHLSISAIGGADGRESRRMAVFSNLAKHHLPDERSRNHAHYDTLTGLSNRWLFQTRLAQTLSRVARDNRQAAALTIDIDHFKFVNDSLGHAAGDLLIQEMARRLLGTLRKQDVVARIGGDEFGIIVPEVVDSNELAEMGQRIIAAMAEPFRLGNDEIFVTVRAGIAIGPRDGQGAEELALQLHFLR